MKNNKTKFMIKLEAITKAEENLVLGIPKNTSEYKIKLGLPNLYKEIIIGSLLGDAYANKPGINNNTRLEFIQGGENHKEYIYWLQDIFKNYIKTEIKPYKNKVITIFPAYSLYFLLIFQLESPDVEVANEPVDMSYQDSLPCSNLLSYRLFIPYF